MILYTIQNESKWNEFQQTGILKSDNTHICCDDFLDSYTWMERKMRELLPHSDIECIHPIWAWYKYDYKNKPDLRRSGHLSKGEIGYRIEFEIEKNKVLLTDFSNWHLILNASDEDRKVEYFHYCELEEANRDDDVPALIEEGFEIVDNQLIFNWNKIILDENSHKRDIQATMWYLKLEQVKSVTKFKAR